MGQRFQVIINLENPVLKFKKQLQELSKKDKTLKQLQGSIESKINALKKILGDKKHCSLVLHNQWLYGRAALLAISNVLLYNKNASEYSNPFLQQTDADFINQIVQVISILNSNLSAKIGRTGIENFHVLNFDNPSCGENIFGHENNDGVCVVSISAISVKYAFLSSGTGDSTVSQIEERTPVSASTYVKLYYPETETDSLYNQPKGTLDEIAALHLQNKRLNRLFIKPFEQFQVLTHDELIILYPESYKEVVQ
jgi:hypothetical protein